MIDFVVFVSIGFLFFMMILKSLSCNC